MGVKEGAPVVGLILGALVFRVGVMVGLNVGDTDGARRVESRPF